MEPSTISPTIVARPDSASRRRPKRRRVGFLAVVVVLLLVATACSSFPKPSATSGPIHHRMSRQIFDEINYQRYLKGVGPLGWDANLGGLALDWSAYISSHGMQHRQLGGLLGVEPFASTFRGLGEIIVEAHAGTSARGVVAIWMSSPSHRAKILNPAYDKAGVGVDPYGGDVHAVVNFGDSR